jgi:hypothetical protein
MMIRDIVVPSPSASSSTNIFFFFELLNPEDEGTMVLKMSETSDLTTQSLIQKT